MPGYIQRILLTGSEEWTEISPGTEIRLLSVKDDWSAEIEVRTARKEESSD